MEKASLGEARTEQGRSRVELAWRPCSVPGRLVRDPAGGFTRHGRRVDFRRGPCKRDGRFFCAWRENPRLCCVAHHLAVFTGSFDPVTYGHLDVLQRARGLFDEIVIAVGHNPDKPGVFSFEERVELLNELVGELVATHPRGAAVRVAHYTGLTVDFAREVGASAIIRGIRNVTDLNAECQVAITNRQVAGIETVFILTSEKYAYASSSLIRQIAAFGGSMDTLVPFVPDRVQLALRAKLDDPSNPLGRLRAEQAQD